MKKLIFLLFLLGCGNPYEKFQPEPDKVEAVKPALSLPKAAAIGLGIFAIFTLYGKLVNLQRARYEFLKYGGIRTQEPKDGRLEVDLKVEHEKKLMGEIAFDNKLKIREGRHESTDTNRKFRKRKKK